MELIAGETYEWRPRDGRPKIKVKYLRTAPDLPFYNMPNQNHTENPSEPDVKVATAVRSAVCSMCWIEVVQTGQEEMVPVDELFVLPD